jgi:GTP 3',8-cyclase
MESLLIDPHGRTIDYLRVSITDLCNLRCIYCMPRDGVELTSHEEILRYEEILTIVGIARDMGVRKVRITGGEPLIRREVVGFLSQLVDMDGIEDVGVTTNGIRLAGMAKDLKAAGLSRINISLDSLNRETFKRITGYDGLEQVLAGIHSAVEEGFSPVKLNVVLLKGANESDVPDFAEMTLDQALDIRFIERMPFGPESVEGAPDSFSAAKALELIEDNVGELEEVARDQLDGPARMFRLKGAKGRVGVINSITGHFCGTCNRLRLTARGTLRPCLMSASELDIKSALREGASREDLAGIIRAAVLAKPLGNDHRNDCANTSMNRIGG